MRADTAYETWRFFACLHRGGRDLRIGLEERIDNERIVKGAPTLKNRRKRFLGGQSWAVRSIGRQRVETVDD